MTSIGLRHEFIQYGPLASGLEIKVFLLLTCKGAFVLPSDITNLSQM